MSPRLRGMRFRRSVRSSRYASQSCGNFSTPSIRLHSVNATWTRERRNSSSTGVGTCPVMRRSLSSCTWNERRAVILREAIHEFFAQRAASSRRDLRQLFRRGRISLAIGLAFLASSIAIGDALASYFQESRWAAILRESLVIGGWVAMWRPLEVFLYDWWPIREEARLFDRLSAMPVRIVCEAETSPDAWRSDWPAVPAADQSSTARAQARSHARDTIGQGVIHDTTRDEAASAHSRRGTKDPGSRS